MALLTPAGCVDGIVQVMGTVAGVGQVHRYRRTILNEQGLKTLMWDNTAQRICGWMISPADGNPATSDRKPGFSGIGVKGGGQVLTTFQFQVIGYFGIDDANASEETFRDLCWAVVTEFNHYGVAPSVPGAIYQSPADIVEFRYVLLAGSMFLHYAKLAIGFQGKTV